MRVNFTMLILRSAETLLLDATGSQRLLKGSPGDALTRKGSRRRTKVRAACVKTTQPWPVSAKALLLLSTGDQQLLKFSLR